MPSRQAQRTPVRPRMPAESKSCTCSPGYTGSDITTLALTDTIGSVERTLIDGRYELRALAGSGGMADVYLAYDRVLDRHVAIKLLKARYSEDEEFIERFRREAKSAASLVNRYIVPIFDWGEADDGTYYIVMEYVPAGDLKDRMKAEGRLSPDAAVDVALQVAEALQAAHERGIIHRDVKPRNILIAGSGHIKVADFGIARAVASTTISQSGDILGSLNYMSPEQAAGEKVGPGSDLYSLGAVLYEMLAGREPFDVTNPEDVAAGHSLGPLSRPRAINSEVPEGLDAIVLRLLAKHPEDRYGSANELIADLRRGYGSACHRSPRCRTTRTSPLLRMRRQRPSSFLRPVPPAARLHAGGGQYGSWLPSPSWSPHSASAAGDCSGTVSVASPEAR